MGLLTVLARLRWRSGANRATQPISTPTFLQMQAVECGAASLGSILAYHGCWVPLEELRVTVGVSRDGANAGNIVKGARYYGMEAHGLRVSSDEALGLPPPFVAFWNHRHFLVVDGADRRGVHLMDPAHGPTTITHDEFDRAFSGVALTLRPGPEFVHRGRPPGILASLLPRLGGSTDAVTLIVLATLFLVVPALVVPASISTFVDDVLVRNFSDWLLPLVIGLVLVAVVDGVLGMLQQLYIARTEVKLTVTMAGELFWHVLRLPPLFFAERYVGDIAARVHSCHRLGLLLSGPISTNAVNFLTVGIYALVMSLISVELTVVGVLAALANAGALRLTSRRLADLNSNLLNKRAKLSGAAMAGLKAIETLKASGTEASFLRTWAGYQTLTVNENQSLGRVSSLLASAPMLLSTLTTAGVLGLGAFSIIEGELSVGGLVAFQFLLGQFSGPIQSLVGFGAQLQRARGDLARIDDVLRADLDPVCLVPDAAPATEFQKLSGRIEVRDLAFRYGPLADDLIDGFDLTVEPGRRVALVGPSGSGKSTLGRLLTGLYRPTRGQVLYDGRPIEEIPRSVFTASLVAVDQDIFLFEGTVAENLTLWDPLVSPADVVQAAKDACIHQEIAARPNGYQSHVAEDGTNFSGGQRQRLEIARALARYPTICILDEATSALDPRTEQQIDLNLRRRGCTCIIIAHRLSTIRDCDEIVVLDRGRVVERGTHDELVARQGRYAALVESQ